MVFKRLSQKQDIKNIGERHENNWANIFQKYVSWAKTYMKTGFSIKIFSDEYKATLDRLDGQSRGLGPLWKYSTETKS